MEMEEERMKQLLKERELSLSKKKINDIWDLHWRLRNESIVREQENKTGGRNAEIDYISKLDDETINFLTYFVENLRLESGTDNLDT